MAKVPEILPCVATIATKVTRCTGRAQQRGLYTKYKHTKRRGVFKAELTSEALKTQKKLVFKGGLCRRAPASRHSRQKRILTIDGLLPPRQEVDSDTRKSRVKRDHSLSNPQKLLKIRYMAPTYYCRGDNQGWPKRPETRPPQAPSL